MTERPAQHVGDDLHVLVPMSPEAAIGGDGVLVEYEQLGEAGELRVPVSGKGKGVVGVQPAVVGVAAGVGGSFGDHGVLL